MGGYFVIWGLVLAAVIIGWIVWGVREYRRTGNAMWLWMAAVMLVSLFATLSQVRRS